MGRYEDRTFGTICHALHPEKTTAFIKQRLELDETSDIKAEVMLVVNGENGLATLCDEGVGWYADSEGKLPINFWGKNGSGGYIDITPEELLPLISDTTMDLADFVRIFGDRLESNLYIWQNYAKGYPQDKMSLVSATMVA